VNNYVGNINYKYYVTMAMSPSTINMAQTWEVLDDTSWNVERLVNKLHGYLCEMCSSSQNQAVKGNK